MNDTQLENAVQRDVALAVLAHLQKESLLMISPSEPSCPGRLQLIRRSFGELGRRGESVPNDAQGGD
jgi:hypothetical protein